MKLKVEQLQVGYGKNVILDAVNLSLEVGKVHYLLGANGSGKSTFLRSLAGLMPVLDGRVILNERPRTMGKLKGQVVI